MGIILFYYLNFRSLNFLRRGGCPTYMFSLFVYPNTYMSLHLHVCYEKVKFKVKNDVHLTCFKTPFWTKALKDSCTKYQNSKIFYTPDVCYNNMKYAMISQLQNPPPEFADVIKSHFYWKKQRILEVIILKIWFTCTFL